MKILVVDDDFVCRTKLAAILSAYGQTETAEDGEQALEMFTNAHEQQQCYDLITLDVEMPGIKGNLVAEKMREWETSNLAEAATIFLAASRQDYGEETQTPLTDNCQGFIDKPVTKQKIEEALSQVGISKMAN